MSVRVRLRVVFDTNVVLSALVFTHGRLSWLQEHFRSARVTLLASHASIAELTRVLAYAKFKLTPLEQFDLLSDYVPYCEIVDLRELAPMRCRDPKDQPFLDLAYNGDAQVLVTGDADLLALAAQTPFAIETPEQYRARFVS